MLLSFWCWAAAGPTLVEADTQRVTPLPKLCDSDADLTVIVSCPEHPRAGLASAAAGCDFLASGRSVSDPERQQAGPFLVLSVSSLQRF